MDYSYTQKKRFRRSFSKHSHGAQIPSLLRLLRRSYRDFLQADIKPSARANIGLQSAFKTVFPINSNSGVVSLEFKNYEIEEPVYGIQECKERGLTYEATVHANIEMIIRERKGGDVKSITADRVYMGDLPMITPYGSFIINGTERVVVSQLHRSPGVLFEHDSGRASPTKKFLFSARVIPYSGRWLDFEFDLRDLIYFRIDRRRKMPVTILLKALGFSEEEILRTFYDFDRFELGRADITAEQEVKRKQALAEDKIAVEREAIERIRELLVEARGEEWVAHLESENAERNFHFWALQKVPEGKNITERRKELAVENIIKVKEIIALYVSEERVEELTRASDRSNRQSYWFDRKLYAKNAEDAARAGAGADVVAAAEERDKNAKEANKQIAKIAADWKRRDVEMSAEVSNDVNARLRAIKNEARQKLRDLDRLMNSITVSGDAPLGATYHFEPAKLLNSNLPFDITDEHGEVIVARGQRIKRSLVRRMETLRDKHQQVTDEVLYDRRLAENVVDENGEVIAKVNAALDEALLGKIRLAGVKEIKTLLTNEIDRGPYISNTMALDEKLDMTASRFAIYRVLRPGEPPSEDVVNRYLDGIFGDSASYDISHIGRMKLNYRLNPDRPSMEYRIWVERARINSLKKSGKDRAVHAIVAAECGLGDSEVADIIRERDKRLAQIDYLAQAGGEGGTLTTERKRVGEVAIAKVREVLLGALGDKQVATMDKNDRANHPSFWYRKKTHNAEVDAKLTKIRDDAELEIASLTRWHAGGRGAAADAGGDIAAEKKRVREWATAAISEARERAANDFVDYVNNFCSRALRENMTISEARALSQKLGDDVPHKILEQTTLSRDDIMRVVRRLVELRNGTEQVDDIDSLANRRVRSVGEFVTRHFLQGLQRVDRAIKDRLSRAETDKLQPHDLISAKAISSSVMEFFNGNQLSQFMDQTNPLSEITHKRRVSALGPGGLTRDRVGFEVRDVHPTHYGRICPVETPEGQNIGLINSMGLFSGVDEYGFLQTRYYKVVDGKPTAEHVDLPAIREKGKVIAQSDMLAENRQDLASKGGLITARKDGDYILARPEEVDYADISPAQMTSVAASMVPFLEHNDANRALMGSNMQRQAVPCLISEKPLVGTGIESKVALDAGTVARAERPGKVVYVDSQRIAISVDPAHISKSAPLGIDVYTLTKHTRTNQNTDINQHPIVKVGDVVRQDDVIADGAGTDLGELALGQNLLVAFLPWNGYNFEDSILISERVVVEERFTSVHIIEEVVRMRSTPLGDEEITRDLPNRPETEVRNLDDEGIIRVGVEVHPGDILVGKLTPRSERIYTPEEKLMQAIFGEKAQDVRDNSLRMPPGSSGMVIDVKVFTGEEAGSGKGRGKDAIGGISSIRADQTSKEDLERYKQNLDIKLQFIEDDAVERIRRLLGLGDDAAAAAHQQRDRDRLNEETAEIDRRERAELLTLYEGKIEPARMRELKGADIGEVRDEDLGGGKAKAQAAAAQAQADAAAEEARAAAQAAKEENRKFKVSLMDIKKDEVAAIRELVRGVVIDGKPVGAGKLREMESRGGGKPSYWYARKTGDAVVDAKIAAMGEVANKREDEAKAKKREVEELEKKAREAEAEARARAAAKAESKKPLTGLTVTQMREERKKINADLLRAKEEDMEAIRDLVRDVAGDGKVLELEAKRGGNKPSYWYKRKTGDAAADDKIAAIAAAAKARDAMATIEKRDLAEGVGVVAQENVEQKNIIERASKNRQDCRRRLLEIERPDYWYRQRAGNALEANIQIEAIAKSVAEEKRRQEKRLYDKRERTKLERKRDREPGVLKTVRVYIAIKRPLQAGDKMAGRHGNKGVVSKIEAVESMPYLADGTPVDVVLNPLGVPSRMNVGQILETHLGFAAKGVGRKIEAMLQCERETQIASLREYLAQVYAGDLTCDIADLSDDELIEMAKNLAKGVPCATPIFDGASESDIRKMLKLADLPESGQVTLYDGRSGEAFDRPVTVGYMYILKLHHLVDEKMHARATGPYSLVTQQPLGGKAHRGGQRFGEMEVWALEAYGAAHTLCEMLTIKSDDVNFRSKMFESIVEGEFTLKSGVPESFNVLVQEIRSLGIDMSLEE